MTANTFNNVPSITRAITVFDVSTPYTCFVTGIKVNHRKSFR